MRRYVGQRHAEVAAVIRGTDARWQVFDFCAAEIEPRSIDIVRFETDSVFRVVQMPPTRKSSVRCAASRQPTAGSDYSDGTTRLQNLSSIKASKRKRGPWFESIDAD